MIFQTPDKTIILRAVTAALFYFILYSFLGWVIDTGYNSLVALSWEPGGFFKSFFLPLPFAPIYGFGAWALISLSFLFKDRYPVALFFTAGIIATAVEYLGGVWMVMVFNRRAWDYSASLLNLDGHIDFWHSILWLILGWAFIKIIHPLGRDLFNKLVAEYL